MGKIKLIPLLLINVFDISIGYISILRLSVKNHSSVFTHFGLFIIFIGIVVLFKSAIVMNLVLFCSI